MFRPLLAIFRLSSRERTQLSPDVEISPSRARTLYMVGP